MWPLTKKAPSINKGIFDETNIPKSHTKIQEITKDELELEKAILDIKDTLKPKLVTGESLPDKQSMFVSSLLKSVTKLLGKQSKKDVFDEKVNNLRKLILLCRANGWRSRKEWKEHHVEMDKAFHEFLSASVAYGEYMYDQNTGFPLNRATNKFEKPAREE
jgi:hypothetical protein